MRDLSSSLERLQQSQRRLSSGRAHERVSDDPRGATDVLFLRGQIARHDQIARTADDTRSRLAVADTTLVGVSDAMIRVKELAVRAGNNGVSDPESRSALATEIRSIRSQLLSDANTEYLGRPLFGGTAAGSAYDTSTGAFTGNAVVEGRTVSEGVRVPANITGEQIFGDQASATGDVFAMLDRLATAVANDDAAAIANESNNLDDARVRIGSAMAEVGRRVAQIEELGQKGAIRREQLVGRLSAIEDVDLAEAVIAVTTNDTAHQAALAAAARAMPPSLAQYLR
jgi:flagellar hook-associated protein 3 FlgL